MQIAKRLISKVVSYLFNQNELKMWISITNILNFARLLQGEDFRNMPKKTYMWFKIHKKEKSNYIWLRATIVILFKHKRGFILLIICLQNSNA